MGGTCAPPGPEKSLYGPVLGSAVCGAMSRPANPDASLTAAQFRLIAVAARQVGLSDPEYRTLLERAAGVRSARQLDQTGFTRVMEQFAQLGFMHRPRVRVPRAGERKGMATKAQLQKIRALWLQWTRKGGDRELRHFLERSYDVSDMRFMTVHVAAMAINGLKVMVERKQGAPTSGRSEAEAPAPCPDARHEEPPQGGS